MNKIGKLVPETTALFVCDIQTKFVPLIHQMPKVILNTKYTMKACNILNIPIIITEQYPKALGNTVDELESKKQKYVFEKTLFSMLTNEVQKTLDTDLKGVKSILLTGIESHVCVFQTSLDLIEKGYDVHILEDAVSSQNPSDRAIAIERLKQSGVFVTSTESAIFQLTKDAKHPNFKLISNLVKERIDLLSPLKGQL
ncbi:hypothetical protein DLAC_06630 [Tieghemostelium lacteum]|uniref:Isochorismatase-like domain-containing protein n=1 Tax=Tieghemostelium lacteum TaxID=361077 RepID=A0A151ZFJ2_TIELA|nr:hypothetical protein DLAC_06630 [Tieghemostelium lacteum]|eukprot:KYQ92634.1 hypothetical protein DLAC_06630 [Tieghemostelium lacteum]